MNEKRGSYLLYKETDHGTDNKYTPYGPRPRRLAKKLQQTRTTTMSPVSLRVTR